MRNIFVAFVAISIMAVAVWAAPPLAGHKVPSMSGWDEAAVAARYVEVNAQGAIATETGTSSSTAEFSITSFGGGGATAAITLSNSPREWVITNLDSTDTVYFNFTTGDADANDYQLVAGASLSGKAALTDFQMYAADTATVQIYAEY